jgi:hypothetical protein
MAEQDYFISGLDPVQNPATDMAKGVMEWELPVGPGGTLKNQKLTYEQLKSLLGGALPPNQAPGLLKAFRLLTRQEIAENGNFGQAFEDLDYSTCCIQTKVLIEFYQPDLTQPRTTNQVLVAIFDAEADDTHRVYVDGSFKPGELVPARFVPIDSPEAQYGYVRRDTDPGSISDWRIGELSIWNLNGTDQFATAKQAGGPFPAFTGAEDDNWQPAAPPPQAYYDATKADLDPATGRLKEGQEPPATGGIEYQPGRGYVRTDGLVFDFQVDKDKRVNPNTGVLEDVPGWVTYNTGAPSNTRLRSNQSLYYACYNALYSAAFLAPWTLGGQSFESDTPPGGSQGCALLASVEGYDTPSPFIYPYGINANVDARVTALEALGGRFCGPWVARTRYKQYDWVVQNSGFYYAKNTFTSGTTFDLAKWTPVLTAVNIDPTGTLAVAVRAGTFTNAEFQGAQPTGSLAGMFFKYGQARYEFMKGDAGTLVWVRSPVG